MKILFEDYYLLVVEKPAGLSTEAGGASHPSAETEALLYFTQTLLKNSTSKRLKVTPYLRAAHRLDRAASGVLVFAKTKMALVALMTQFEQRTVEKIYLAVTDKTPRLSENTLTNWLKKDADGKKALIFVKEERGSQPCELSYKITAKKGAGALLEVHPVTGRYHQIRAQLAHIGCPISGDVLYGAKPWVEHEMKLHAHRLTIAHPKTGEPMTFEALPPDTW